MMKACKQSRLTLELLAQAFIGKERFFQGNRGIEALIDGLVDGAHTALSKLANDAIAAL